MGVDGVSPLRLVSFDVGGTLVRCPTPSFTAQAMETARQRGTSERMVRDLVLTSQLRGRALVQLERFCGSELARSVSHRSAAPMSALPGAVEMVKAVAGMARVVSLSNVSPVDAASLPDGLDHLLARSYRSCDIGAAKPSRHAFLSVAEGEGIDVTELVHVGDGWRPDAMGALRAGARCVWLNSSWHRSSVLVPAQLVVATRPADVPRAVRYLLAGGPATHGWHIVAR